MWDLGRRALEGFGHAKEPTTIPFAIGVVRLLGVPEAFGLSFPRGH
ncbi:hypothetical protein CRG98_048827, partial [Punica granatum]